MTQPEDAITTFVDRMYTRLVNPKSKRAPRTPWSATPAWGVRRLQDHLEDFYGVRIGGLTELDMGVFLVEGPDWIARVFPAARPLEAVEGDAEILRFLEGHDFPAERCAHADAVSAVDGQGVLVTRRVLGTMTAPTRKSLHVIGGLLGQLHTLPAGEGATRRPAGAWHGITPEGGTRRDDIDRLLPLLEAAAARGPAAARPLYAELRAELLGVDLCEQLPHCLIHVDLGGPNVLVDESDTPTVIDWAGAGWGPRVFSLAAAMAGAREPRRVDAFVEGYLEHVELEEDELARLGGALRLHGLILEAWAAVFAPDRIPGIVDGLVHRRGLAEDVAARFRTRHSGWRTAPTPHLLGVQFGLLAQGVYGHDDDEIEAFAVQFGGLEKVCAMVFYDVRAVPRTIECSVAFVLSDSLGWVVKVSEGAIAVTKKVAKKAPVIVRAEPCDFLRLATGDPAWAGALGAGRAHIEGDVKELEKLFAGNTGD